MEVFELLLEPVLELVVAVLDWTYGRGWSGTWQGALFLLVVLLAGLGMALAR